MKDYGSIIDWKRYESILKIIGSLTRLSSDSLKPYIGYRIVENSFCEAFNADNLSRSDCSADAKIGELGFGIKTFLNGNGKTLQKVAEFNREAKTFIQEKQPIEIAKVISKMRNERIRSTKVIHGLNKIIYHCVVRENYKIMIYDEVMDEININQINKINMHGNTIYFKDNINEYSINLSKSTLYKRFITKNVRLEIDINILENPFKNLEEFFYDSKKFLFSKVKFNKEFIYLPLFSDKGGRNVPKKSGLNQWNAEGRTRNTNELYIPIPKWIHDFFPKFFPNRNEVFYLILPNDKILKAKVCQDNGKALMSNPNSELGKWLLRDVLLLKEGSLVEYSKLEELGLDSVVVYKESKNRYKIDFTKIGSYDDFSEKYRKI